MTIQSKPKKLSSTEEGAKATDTISSSRSSRLNFRQVAPQGFGDRYNSWAWSMLWWKGKLYVGTNRAWHCAERVGINSAFPLFVKYPPPDPDAECAPHPYDLPLQAEIWSWTPESDQWERLYQSPQDVPIPGQPGKYVAREVGFRGMAVFAEPDGAEAMYVSGVNARFIFRPVFPPRLLRSTDGRTFEPIPQEPGTFLGQLDTCTFRTIISYKERFFVSTGTIQGDGVLLESRNPAAGNDHFRQVTPPGMTLFEMALFNGYLYLGVRDSKRGYAVMKTDATGSPPYTFTPVITEGAFLPQPSRGVLSMHVFKGRLYVGTDRSATEVIRINPDDSWDLVVGTPRETPDGWKYPLSGLDAGFSNWLNYHIWRMETYKDRLYIGTCNMATEFREIDGAASVLEPNYGFDLYQTDDGWHYTPVTLTGFDDKFNYGLRSLVDTPYGLFLGTANKWYGLQIWRGTLEETIAPPLESGEVAATETTSAISRSESQLSRPTGQSRRPAVSICAPPEYLEVEDNGGKIVLSWESPSRAKQFRIWRAKVTDERSKVEANPFLARMLRIVQRILSLMPNIYLPPLPDKLWIPGAYEEIGVTKQFYFEDTTTVTGQRYLYYVRAENQNDAPSFPSNIVALPRLIPPVTIDGLLEILDNLVSRGKLGDTKNIKLIREEISQVRLCIEAGDVIDADNLLQALSDRLTVTLFEGADPLILADLQIMLKKLRRRIALNQVGYLAST